MHYIPIRLYGDGAEAQQPFEIYTMLSVLHAGSSTLDSRILLACRNVNQTRDTARDLILDVLAWSFECLCNLDVLNIYDPCFQTHVGVNTQRMTHGALPSARNTAQSASQRLLRALLAPTMERLMGDGVQGDADFISHLFKLKRNLPPFLLSYNP